MDSNSLVATRLADTNADMEPRRDHRDGSGIREVERRQRTSARSRASFIVLAGRLSPARTPHAAFPSFGAFTSPRLGPLPPFLEQFLLLHHRPSGRLRGPELVRGEVVAARVSKGFPLDDVAIETERRIELVEGDQAPEDLREALRGLIVGRS